MISGRTEIAATRPQGLDGIFWDLGLYQTPYLVTAFAQVR